MNCIQNQEGQALIELTESLLILFLEHEHVHDVYSSQHDKADVFKINDQCRTKCVHVKLLLYLWLY